MAIVVLALIVAIAPCILVRHPIAYIPLVTLVIALIVSYVYLRVLVKGLSYSEDSLLPSCERGSHIEFVVNFKNDTPLVFTRLEPSFYISDLFGNVDEAIPASMMLMPREERDFSFEATFEHIGSYSAGVREIVVWDLLGLFSKTIVNPNRHSVEVLPRLFDVSRADLTNVSAQETQKSFQPLVTDDLDYAGVREYVWGDQLKTIHWKLSARNEREDYYTRLFETMSNPGLTIILDHTAPDYSDEDLMCLYDGVVESALSLNEHAHERGVDPELRFMNKVGEKARMRILDPRDFVDLMTDLPRITREDGHEAEEILRLEANSIHGQDNVAFCTSHVDERVISLLVDLRMRKRNPLLFVVVPRSLEDRDRSEFLRPLNRLRAAGIVFYVISSAGELGGEC